jgi:phosphate transport system substrate-binding protein
MNKKLHLLILFFFILAFMIGACAANQTAQPTVQPNTQSTASLNGTLSISGAFALYPMMQTWSVEYTKVNPEVQFNISAGGAGKGMTDVLSGAVDIGMISREITFDEVAKGAYGIAVTKDAVFPTINAQNPVLQDVMAQGITKETFEKIYITGEYTTWGQVVGKPEITDLIHVYTRSDSCGASDVWAKYLGNKKQENLLGIGVSGDPGVLAAVVKDPLGIGYNNLNYAFDTTTGKPVAGISVVPIDVNENGKADPDEIISSNTDAIAAISSGKYPSPPARVEYLATNGKPTGLTQNFIEWILTDGQKFVSESGYVPLTQDQINESLNRLR